MRTLHINSETKLGVIQQPLECGCWVDGCGTKDNPFRPVLCHTHNESGRTAQILDADYRELVAAAGIDFDATSHPDRVEAVGNIAANAYQQCCDHVLQLHLDNFPNPCAIERLHKAYVTFYDWAEAAKKRIKELESQDVGK